MKCLKEYDDVTKPAITDANAHIKFKTTRKATLDEIVNTVQDGVVSYAENQSNQAMGQIIGKPQKPQQQQAPVQRQVNQSNAVVNPTNPKPNTVTINLSSQNII